ncbi:MAG: hypothetical protein MRZ79_06780 [Bacteroidia bacterium]|nr:hypothetical protein [Bacteroidia bacterium]
MKILSRNNILASLAMGLCICMSACLSIEIGGSSFEYSKLDSKQREAVVFLDTSLNFIPRALPGKLYAVHAKHLLASMKKDSEYLIYLWDPDCKAEGCVPISAMQRFADKKGYILYVILDYKYDPEILEFLASNTERRFLLNYDYYDVDNVRKVNDLFRAELLGRKPKDEENWRRSLVMKNGEFQYTLNGIDEAKENP